jgi:CheY-like chemotaxis protein
LTVGRLDGRHATILPGAGPDKISISQRPPPLICGVRQAIWICCDVDARTTAMKILVADDDLVSRRLLQGTLERWGYETVLADSGETAWEIFQQPEAPTIAILDWMMPGLDGTQVCRLAREQPATVGVYILLLSAKDRKEDLIQGLESGANDYLTKPFDRDELRARLRVGVRMVELQQMLARRVAELQQALAEVKTLEGIIPICMYCKRIRDDQDFWGRVEAYITQRSNAQFSHGVCPDCWNSEVAPELQRLNDETRNEV